MFLNRLEKVRENDLFVIMFRSEYFLAFYCKNAAAEITVLLLISLIWAQQVSVGFVGNYPIGVCNLF